MAGLDFASCITCKMHKQLLDIYKPYVINRQLINIFAKSYAKLSSYQNITTMKIPVVVHVVYQKGHEEQYISDDQIRKQIEILNRDFHKLNADLQYVRNLVPDYFNLAANTLIEFRLAERDPECRSSKSGLTGVTRTETSVDGFTPPDFWSHDPHHPQFDPHTDTVKHAATGGHDPWPPESYLNIWVCKLNPYPYTDDGRTVWFEIYGYGSFPGWPRECDGIVMDYRSFGNKPGTVRPRTNGGRRLVHEVGHWLNLYHVAGDLLDNDDPCKDSDAAESFVDDTPNQKYQNSYCPFNGFDPATSCNGQSINGKCRFFTSINCDLNAGDYRCPISLKYRDPEYWVSCTESANGACSAYPYRSCPGGSPETGDMFMNYMDSTQDCCAVMFTAGQAKAMEATLRGTRGTILDSLGAYPPPGAGPVADPSISHSPDDIGDEPDSRSKLLHVSEDIWVNAGEYFADDGRPMVLDHENPVHGQLNIVYVRVRNRGCMPTKGGVVKLYWAKASTGLGWPAPWDGSVTSPLMGGRIEPVDGKPIGVIEPGHSIIIPFNWYPPNPQDYSAMGADRTHFCLLARIETETVHPYGMTTPEGSSLWDNLRNNNNIAMRNITIAEKVNGIWHGHVTINKVFKKHLPKIHKKPEKIIFKKKPPESIKLFFIAPVNEQIALSGLFPASIFKWGTVGLDIDKEIFQNWKDHDGKSDGLTIVDDGKFTILHSGAWIELPVDLAMYYTISFTFTPQPGQDLRHSVLTFDIVQKELVSGSYQTVGGQRFVVRTPE
ncbi:hypothetical protein MCP_2386 [Methanocella paludicola SANAE]|uniref:Peptidase M43 pregnancy-associated plasma-A domain-containing protein n=1 Tax=Methanocella paludicola (strain DSM 17711 / JCM 13418 / NBRC 101707 / SANAE) TaxID=304371 RepID=D1Z186_METPS|nr:hypothetical protein [Methanocella paludicola]BAI62458.1 hypothetical protein MCP_2386 [Methanocella paludicola SANAE]